MAKQRQESEPVEDWAAMFAVPQELRMPVARLVVPETAVLGQLQLQELQIDLVW